MTTELNRWALSALSKSRKSESQNEEIMIDKSTGEFLIKTLDGYVISYDSLNRLKNHINTVTANANNFRIQGDMFSLEIPEIEFPNVVWGDTNLLSGPLLLKTSLKKVLISIDMDCLIMNATGSKLSQYEPDIRIDYSFETAADGETTPTTPDETSPYAVTPTSGTPADSFLPIIKPLSQSNRNVIYPIQDYGIDFTNYDAYLQNITIIPNANETEGVVRYIIHSILVVIE